jgi:hypothetical protein
MDKAFTETLSEFDAYVKSKKNEVEKINMYMDRILNPHLYTDLESDPILSEIEDTVKHSSKKKRKFSKSVQNDLNESVFENPDTNFNEIVTLENEQITSITTKVNRHSNMAFKSLGSTARKSIGKKAQKSIGKKSQKSMGPKARASTTTTLNLNLNNSSQITTAQLLPNPSVHARKDWKINHESKDEMLSSWISLREQVISEISQFRHQYMVKEGRAANDSVQFRNAIQIDQLQQFIAQLSKELEDAQNLLE